MLIVFGCFSRTFPVEVTHPLLSSSSDKFPAELAAAPAPLSLLSGKEHGSPRLQREFALDSDEKECMASNF